MCFPCVHRSLNDTGWLDFSFCEFYFERVYPKGLLPNLSPPLSIYAAHENVSVDQAEDMSVDQAEDMSVDQAEDSSGDRAEDMSGDRAEDMSGDRAEDMSGGRAEDMSGDRAENMSGGRAEDMSGDRAEERKRNPIHFSSSGFVIQMPNICVKGFQW